MYAIRSYYGYSVFSVISPEGCSAILWNDPSKVEVATKALKITPSDLYEHKLVDDVLDEPLIVITSYSIHYTKLYDFWW